MSTGFWWIAARQVSVDMSDEEFCVAHGIGGTTEGRSTDQREKLCALYGNARRSAIGHSGHGTSRTLVDRDCGLGVTPEVFHVLPRWIPRSLLRGGKRMFPFWGGET